MVERPEPWQVQRRGGEAPTIIAPRSRRGEGARSQVPTDAGPAQASTRRFALQRNLVSTSRHAMPEPGASPTRSQPRPTNPFNAAEGRDRAPGAAPDSALDWVEPTSPKRIRLALGVAALVAIVAIFMALGGSHPKDLAATPAPAPAPVAPAAETTPAPSEAPPVPAVAEVQPAPPIEVAPTSDAIAPARPSSPRLETREPRPTEAARPAQRTTPREPEPRPTRPADKATPADELAVLIADAPSEGDYQAYITSRPSGAVVMLEGRYVGRTPTHVAWSGKDRRELELNLPEHDSTTLVLGPKSSGRTLSVVLDETADESESDEVADEPDEPVAARPAAPVRAPAPKPPEPTPAAKKKDLLEDAFKDF